MAWLTGRLYGRPDMPRRVTWLAIFVTACTLTSWLGGRVVG